MAPIIPSDQGQTQKLETNKVLIDGYVRYTMNTAVPLYQDIMNMIYSNYGIGHYESLDFHGLSANMYTTEDLGVEYAHFDAEQDKYLAISVNYRGDLKQRDIDTIFQWLTTTKKLRFVQ